MSSQPRQDEVIEAPGAFALAFSQALAQKTGVKIDPINETDLRNLRRVYLPKDKGKKK